MSSREFRKQIIIMEIFNAVLCFTMIFLSMAHIVHGGDVSDPCVPVPCQNDGNCTTIDPTHYACSCSMGYTGRNCETALPKDGSTTLSDGKIGGIVVGCLLFVIMLFM